MSKRVGFLEKVAGFLEEHDLLRPGMRVVVGVSGGPDSVALLHVLKELKEKYSLELYAAHLNHMLRPTAGEEATFVGHLAHAWGIPFFAGFCRVERLARKKKMGVEAAGRYARYRFLEHVARRVGADRLAVGHQADDLVETVLLHLIRGTGPRGLAGILPRRGRLIRPLLGVTRKEVEEYCRKQGLEWRLDTSNLDPSYLRNKVRLQLLPYLRRCFNPRVDAALWRLAQVAREENKLLERIARFWVKRLLRGRAQGGVDVSLPRFRRLPRALQRRVFRLLFSAAGGGLDLGFRHVEECLTFLRRGPRSGTLHLPGGLEVRKEGDVFFLTRQRVRGEEERKVFVPLAVPGVTLVPELGWEFSARIEEALPGEACPRPLGDRYQAFFDYDKIKLPLYVRTRLPGDKIRPPGLGGTKKLKKLFAELKIPSRLRGRVPLVASRETIYWVVGYRTSEEARVTPETRRVLVLEAYRRGEPPPA